MKANYDLILQVAINQMASDLSHRATLALLHVSLADPSYVETIYLDHTMVKEFIFTDSGVTVDLWTQASRLVPNYAVEIHYHAIDLIVCYYDNSKEPQTLYSRK